MYDPNQPLVDSKALLLSLSTEELTLIVAAMHIPKFVGFRPPEMPVAAAQAAERSLRLRQMAAVNQDGKFVVDINIARLLSVCAVPKQMLVVRPYYTQLDGYFTKPYETRLIPRLHFFAAHGNDMVYHNRSTPGVHTFATMNNADMVKITLASILQTPNVEAVPDTDVTSYEVDYASLVMAEELYRKGGADAVYDRMINDLNAPPSLARALATRKKHLMGVVWRDDWEEEGYAYTEDTLVSSAGLIAVPCEEGGFWAYSIEGNDPRMANFQAVNAVTLIEEMVNRLHAKMGLA